MVIELTTKGSNGVKLNILNYLSNDNIPAFCLCPTKTGQVLAGCGEGKVRILGNKFLQGVSNIQISDENEKLIKSHEVAIGVATEPIISIHDVSTND